MSNTTINTANGAVRLSPELLDRILDFLHSSVPSLTSSSLVCRNWLPTTRYHLFSTPVLYQVSFGRSPRDNTGSFIELLGSPQCTFRHTIQGCVLNIQKVRILKNCIDALAAANVRLTGRLLIAQYIGDISFMNDLQIHTRFPSIRNFVYAKHDTWPLDLPQLVISLEHLESLSVFARPPRNKRMPDFPVISKEHALSRLRTLRLRIVNPSKWLTWMASLPGYTPQIQALNIHVYTTKPDGWGLLGSLKAFLAANRNTLEDLTISVQHQLEFETLYDEPVIAQLDLGTLPNMRSLTLRTHDIDSLCSSLAAFLGSTSTSLEILNLYIITLASDDSEEHVRAKLQETFEGQFYDKIKLLHIVFSYPISGNTIVDKANSDTAAGLSREILPSWEIRGALMVGIAGGAHWQPDSLEKTNFTIWGSGIVPFGKKITRIGTL